MPDRRERGAARQHRAQDAQTPDWEGHAERDALFRQAGAIVTEEALPGIEAFRAYMTAQNRKLEVAPYLDHIEGPQIVVHISRPDGRITATLVAEVLPTGIQTYWDVRSTGRVKTHWIEKIKGGPAALTRDHVLEKLTELYLTDFS